MRKVVRNTLIALASLGFAASAMAQAPTKEIRVLLANHPYGELLKAAIPEFESATESRSMRRASRKVSSPPS